MTIIGKITLPILAVGLVLTAYGLITLDAEVATRGLGLAVAVIPIFFILVILDYFLDFNG